MEVIFLCWGRRKGESVSREVSDARLTLNICVTSVQFGFAHCGKLERIKTSSRALLFVCVSLLRLYFHFCQRSLIIATGAEAVWLGAEGEEEVRGKGVSTCATCDGAFLKGKEVRYLYRNYRTVRYTRRCHAQGVGDLVMPFVSRLIALYTIVKWRGRGTSEDRIVGGAIPMPYWQRNCVYFVLALCGFDFLPSSKQTTAVCPLDAISQGSGVVFDKKSSVVCTFTTSFECVHTSRLLWLATTIAVKRVRVFRTLAAAPMGWL